MNVAIFGGSFDPPHIGHLAIAKRVLRELNIDLLLIVPTYLNPFKSTYKAPPQKRLQWLKKIFFTEPKVLVSDFEIRQRRPVYAIETVEYVKRRFAPKKIYFVIGSDNLKDLHRWKNYRKLRKEVEFVVVTRPGFRSKSPFKTIRLSVPISSTQLRKKPIQRYLPKIVSREIMRFYS